MRIVYVYADHPGEGACSTWLCRFPAAALDRIGHDVHLIHTSEFVKRPPSADIIVVERLLWNGSDLSRFDQMSDGPAKTALLYWSRMHVLDTVEQCQSNGAKVMAVFDDHYDAYPDTHPELRARWLEGKFNGHYAGFVPIDDFKRGLGVVDAVMTPSAYLAEYYGGWARKMYAIHNRPDLAFFQIMPNRMEPRKLVVGWGGTAQHELSWRNSDALGALRELKDRIRLSGHFPLKIRSMLDDAGIEYEHNGWVDYDMYPSIVAGFDIGICPLAGEYDKGRSWIKWLECSLMGKPVIAEDIGGVYDECVGGFYAHSHDDWVESLLLLMDDDIYRDVSYAGTSWAWQQSWDTNIGELLEIFGEVIGV